MTKVSIIVPVYNVEKYIEKCLESLVNQTFQDIEIIVVNDGTKDNSQEIIDKYTKNYPAKIRSYIKENGGVSSARNYGIHKSKGEYIMFVDGDDYISKDMAEKMYSVAADKNMDIVVCNMFKVYGIDKLQLYKCNYALADNPVKNYIIGDPGPCAKLIKKSIFKNVQFRNIYYEDLDVMPTLVLYTNKIEYLDEPLYYYRQVDGSATRQTSFNDKLLDIFEVLENVECSLKDKYYDEVEYLYICHLLRTMSLRLLSFNDTRKYLDKIIKTINAKFPKYFNNIYYKKSSLKTRIICFLAYHRQWNLLKLIKMAAHK